MKIVRMPWPVYDEKSAGNHYIQPLDSFTENGYWWSVRLEFPAETYAFPVNESKTLAYRTWGRPKVVRSIGDMVRLNDGTVCRCKACLKGRRLVKDGWTPWGKDFCFPS